MTEDKRTADTKKWGLWKGVGRFYFWLSFILVQLVLFNNFLKLCGINADGAIRSLFAQSKKLEVLVVFPNTKVGQDIKKVLVGPDGTDKLIAHDVTLHSITEDSLIKTERQLISELTDRQKEVLLVVGHETSTSAKYLIEKVYQAASFVKKGRPIPLILPAVTNPDITKENDTLRHILRLPATDDIQAEVVATLLKRAGARAALILDSSNSEYSNYIAKSLINSSVSSVVDSIGVSLDGAGFSPSKFLINKPNMFAFIGMHTQACLFLKSMGSNEQLPANRSGIPYTYIFTDGVVSEFFSSFLSANYSSYLSPIYITAPIPLKPEFLNPGSVIGPEISYKDMGTITRDLIDLLIERASAEKQLTQRGILNQIRLIIRNKERISFNQPYDYILRFNERGENELGKVHIFSFKDGVFSHSEKCPCNKPKKNDY